MNVIEIQNLITKNGTFNKNIDLKEYYKNGDEILKLELEAFEESNNELKRRLLIQLKEKSDVELLQEFIKLIDIKGRDLQEFYHRFRIKLAESNNSNPVYDKSIPILCKLLDIQLDYLSNLKSDLLSKIAYFDYRISADFDTSSESNQNKNYDSVSKVTFNISKKESLMLLYILEEVNLLKFDNNTQRKNFIEQNFNFTEVRNNEFYGKSFPMTGIQSEYSKFNSKDREELKSNNRTLDNLSKKLITIMEDFKFEKK